MSPRWNPNPDVRNGRHVVHNLHVHLVFVTKYRRKAMTDAMLTRCEEIMRVVCTDFEAELQDANVLGPLRPDRASETPGHAPGARGPGAGRSPCRPPMSVSVRRQRSAAGAAGMGS